MKIIHCSDLHLDSKMERKLSLTKSSERRNELLNNFQRLISFAKENDVKAILISGDLFDSNSARVSTKNVLNLKKYFYIKKGEEIPLLFY